MSVRQREEGLRLNEIFYSLSKTRWKNCATKPARNTLVRWARQTISRTLSLSLGGKSSCSLLLLLSGLAFGFALSLLLLDVLGEELLVLLVGLSRALGLGIPVALHNVLAAETGIGDEALDLGGLVEGLVTTLDLTAHYVAAHIVLLLVEAEGLHDAHAGLGALAVGALNVGDAIDVLLALLDHAEEESGDVGVHDAAADRLALAVAVTAGPEGSAGYRGQGLVVVIIKYCDWIERTKSDKARNTVVINLPFLKRMRVLWLRRMPCFMGKPCLSLPPVMRKT